MEISSSVYVSSAQRFSRGLMSDTLEPLAVVVDYDGLITALRRRAITLNTPLKSIDDVARLPTRYTTKLLGQRRMLGPMSFGAILGALCLELHVVPVMLRSRGSGIGCPCGMGGVARRCRPGPT